MLRGVPAAVATTMAADLGVRDVASRPARWARSGRRWRRRVRPAHRAPLARRARESVRWRRRARGGGRRRAGSGHRRPPPPRGGPRSSRTGCADMHASAPANFSSMPCHQSKPTRRKMSIGPSTGPGCQSVPCSLRNASDFSIAGTAAAMHTAGKITILKPDALELRHRARGRLAADDHVGEQRRLDLPRHPPDLVHRLRAPRRRSRRRRPARSGCRGRSRPRGEVTARASVRAMMTKSGSVRYSEAARILSAVLLGGDHLLARDVPALLGRHLVLDVEPRHARLLVFAHRAHHVEHVAVAGVGVGDHRQRDARASAPRGSPSR